MSSSSNSSSSGGNGNGNGNGSDGSPAAADTNHRDNPHGQKHYLIMDAGKERIKRMMSMGKPNQAIHDFSAQNGLDIPAADAIYGLLHSLGHTKWGIHESVLRATLLSAEAHIQKKTLPPEQHIALLSQMKHYLAVPRLQHLPLMLLERHPGLVPDDICEAILQTPGLYQKCSVAVKRELWRRDYNLFAGYMMPLIENYAKNEELLDMSREIFSTNVKSYSRRRRVYPALTQISSAIDADLKLYMQTLGMVRHRFLETNNPVFGTLRLDLAMSMHENDVSEITRNDVCHKLAWSLDACIMKQIMDDRRVLELQKYFDGIDPDNAPYGEIALILSSPYSRHILAQYIFSILKDIAPNAQVSTRYTDLTWPSLMSIIGLSAHTLLSQERPKIPKVDRSVTRVFFRSIIPFILASDKHDHKLGSYQLHLQKGSVGKKAQLNHAGAFPDSDSLYSKMGNLQPSSEDISILSSSELARQVLHVFLLKRIAEFDMAMLNIWLPAVSEAFKASLGLPDTAYVRTAADDTHQPDVALELRQNAFECDAFMLSLVLHIKETKGVAAAIVNSAIQGLDLAGQGIKGANTDGVISHAIEAVPLLGLFDQLAHVRHCAHEQVISFLIECTSILSTEYSTANGGGSNNNNNGGGASDAVEGLGSQSQTVPIHNKESAVYFVFVLAEHAAAKYAVDPEQLDKLGRLYHKLAAVSPPQAFEYRISSTNCLHSSKFLKK
ncbi:hypothetical protein H4217_005682 [Coemansia sp. RSA 1939]|nr:hypothetical protein H4217_005682 [Coemansia sp. RSA 1939]KAJ2614914.1 hypothetical protein EV177_001829 [Coemansia sp. RSA 1804]